MPTAWWVNQGATFAQEMKGGYVWAPTKTKAGHPVEHHANVSRLQPGDAIIHYAVGSIRAIGFVREKPELQQRPSELPGHVWSNDGHFAKIEYHLLANPIPIAEVPGRVPDAGPFDRTGGVNQVYLTELSPQFAANLYRTFSDRWPVQWLPSGPQP